MGGTENIVAERCECWCCGRRHVCAVDDSLTLRASQLNGAHLPHWVASCHWNLCSSRPSLSSPSSGKSQSLHSSSHHNSQPNLPIFGLLLIFCFVMLSQEYYHNLLSSRHCSGITVKQDGNFGKGTILLRLILSFILLLFVYVLIIAGACFSLTCC